MPDAVPLRLRVSLNPVSLCFPAHPSFPIMHLSLPVLTPSILLIAIPRPPPLWLHSLPILLLLFLPSILLSGPRPMCEMSSLQRWPELCGEMPRRAAGCQQFHLQVRQSQQRVSSMPRQLHPGVSGGLWRHRDVCLCIKISGDLSSVCLASSSLSDLWVMLLTSENVATRGDFAVACF